MTDEAYIPVAECRRRHVYRLRSRNLAFGVFAPEKDNGFIGIREKFGNRFLFTEHHWDNGPPYGTAKPVEDLGPLRDERIRLWEAMPTTCGYCGERVEYEQSDEGVEKDGNVYPGEWVHLGADGSCSRPDPQGNQNMKLLRELEAVGATKAADPKSDSVTTSTLQAMLLLIMGKSEGGVVSDLSDVPSAQLLDKLTPEQREEVADWAASCHAEASDNDVEARPCPEPLRDLLPEDHPYKTWRVG